MTDVIIRPLDATLIDQTFDLATEVFATSSTIHAALGVDLETYRASLRPSFEAMVAEGMSLAALDPDDTLLGGLIATDMHTTLSDEPRIGPYPEIAALTQALTRRFLGIRAFKAGEVLLVDMAAVHPGARGRGVYRTLRKHVQGTARDGGWCYVVGELSSPATQRVVLDQMGHEKAAEIAFADFEWNGSRPFAGITSPRSIILAEGAL